MKFILHFLARLLFRFRSFNTGVLKTPGPVLLVPNHASWFDWLFVGVCLDDDWRFVTSSVTAQTSWLHKIIMVNRRTFPIDTNSPYAVKRMAEYLEQGGRLVLFAEGRISRTGSLMKLYDGTGFLLYKTGAKVITAHLRGAVRLPASPHPGWRQWCPRVSAHFSDVLQPPLQGYASTIEARTKLTNWLHDRMARQQFDVEMEFGERNVLEAIVNMSRHVPHAQALEDIAMKPLTYRRLIVSADVMAGELKTRLRLQGASSPPPNPGSETPALRVGVLLPNTNAFPVTLLALWAIGRVPAILNYTIGKAALQSCVELAGLRQIITSRVFLERFKLDLAAITSAGVELIYLEDVRLQISSSSKLTALIGQFFGLNITRQRLHYEATAVILFTSGSEGLPKGVELTHRNLLANLRQMWTAVDIQDTDRFFNALPLFHSFGLVIGLLVPLARGLYVFLYPSPLHYRVVPNACYDRRCTIMFGTNTFLNGYARKAHPYDFHSVRYLFAGAEKVQEVTVRTWNERFGVRIIEGYGATECSPCVSANTPKQPRSGTVGRFLPAIEYKLEPVEGVEVGGRLFVRGPNIMKGYLNPDANAKFQALGGWYDTGDIVKVDGDGFVSILGRLKRFAKVSGEMVSLTAVEDALAGAFPQFGQRCQIAVIARPDEDKGEKLIAVTNEAKLTLNDLRVRLRDKGFSPLNAPREIVVVKEIPKLGTGKVNHRELEKSLKTGA